MIITLKDIKKKTQPRSVIQQPIDRTRLLKKRPYTFVS